MRPPAGSRRGAWRGFSLIEFMIAATLSVIVLAALTTAFVSNSRTRDEMDRASQQIENGRYSDQVLADDLSLAGFFGELDQYCGTCTGLSMYYVPISTPLAGTALPDPCATGLTDLRQALPFHVQGFYNVASGAAPTCLDDVKPGTDILVIRRVSTCIAGTSNCAMLSGAPYFQASLCNSGTELASTAPYDVANPARYALDTAVANLTKHKKDCSATADLRRYLVHIYYVANNDQPGDKIPTLKRVELDYNKGTCATRPSGNNKFCIVPVAEGVEQLHFEYGIDYTNDGQPDVIAANPNAYTAPAGKPGANCPTTPSDCVTNWLDVVSVKMNILVQATTTSPNMVASDNNKIFHLGLKDDGSAFDVGPFYDQRKRHVFNTSVWLNNPAARRAS